MSETTPDTPAAVVSDESTTAPETESGTATDASTANPDKGGNSEAAKYRVRLRETEERLTATEARLASAHRRVVDNTVSAKVSDVTDFWSHTELSDLLDDDGNVDGDKVTAAVDTLLTAKPHYRKPSRVTESTSSVGSRDRIYAGGGDATSWADVLSTGSSNRGRPAV